jgi:microcystin-dependent protein
MAEPYLGQIISVGFGFAPAGWYPCDGRLLDISSNEALYALLGTTYGGNGQTTFALPNLNGRVPLGVGQGQGLSSYVPGEIAGTESVTLVEANTPPHTHDIAFSAENATLTSPKPATPSVALAVGANAQTLLKGLYTAKEGTIALKSGTISRFVGGQPHENRQQFLVLNYIIAYAGLFPSQS